MEILNPFVSGSFLQLSIDFILPCCFNQTLPSKYGFIKIVTIVFNLKCFDFWLILGSHLAPSPLSELPLEEKFYQGENH